MRDTNETSDDPLAGSSDHPLAQAEDATVTLRVLATSDIHMQLLGFDYIQDRPTGNAGFAGLATLIRAARREADAAGIATVLFDNGDLLQGTVLGRRLARQPVTEDHPVVACLQRLDYDALGLGNHDLDNGIGYVSDIADQLNIPVVSSNLAFHGPTPIRRSALIRRSIAASSDGRPRSLDIGLVSALPERTAIWNAYELEGHASVTPARPSLTAEVERLRAAGADIVILLAHMGIEGALPDRRTLDDARRLARVPGVDAIISGHTHRRLPGSDHAGFNEVDAQRGVLGDRPAAMPGFDASDLAVLDLKLRCEKGGWKVLDHKTELRPNDADVPPDAEIAALCRGVHEDARRALSRRCGEVRKTLHNFFSLAMPTATCALVASAKRRIVRRGLAHTAYADWPVIASSAAHTAGGRAGPSHFLHVSPGTVSLRHLAGLSPYANAICGLKITGREVLDWLEHAAGVFQHLHHGAADQPLIAPDRPAFDFDTIFGLTYTIDPTRPKGDRIGNLRHDGRPVTAQQNFILATSAFRAAGGGGGRKFGGDRTIFRSDICEAPDLMAVLGERADWFGWDTLPWRFSDAARGASALLLCSPLSIGYLDQIAHLSPRHEGSDPQGFARVRITL